mmetsp:Transcript_43230/g.104690  ORF Transcript_43230/g.104690 Transcript_43230/m.104690 type:complete len:562 (+) Transcript_43230:262-1947(+)
MMMPTTRQRNQKRRLVATAAAAAAATGVSILFAILSRGSGLSASRSTIGVEGFRPLSIPRGSGGSSVFFARYHDANQQTSTSPHRSLSPPSKNTRTGCLWSSIGGGNDPPPSNNGGGGDNDDDGLGDFLDPQRLEESESLKRAREYMSETSLPISFDDEKSNDNISSSDDQGDGRSGSSTTGNSNDDDDQTLTPSSSPINSATSSALFGTDGSSMMPTGSNSNQTSSDLLAKNPYMQVVSQISPSELISKFTATANPRVQEAVRTTILGLIGSLPKLAFETTSITTGQRLASLMFQLQMTGYMFKNAEYRMSMQHSLGMYNQISSNLLLTGSPTTTDDGGVDDDDDDDYDQDEDPLLSGKIKGKIKVHYGGSGTATSSSSLEDGKTGDNIESIDSDSSNANNNDGIEIEVDAAAYMSELRSEVKQLRDELTASKQENEAALQQDLLMYIRTLPAQELKSLTNTMSQDVLVCMKGLVKAVLAGIGDGQIGPETVTEQSGEAMAQLCMWQLAVGYNLRELEVREEMKKNLSSLVGDTADGDETSSSNDPPTDGTPPSPPGAFE